MCISLFFRVIRALIGARPYCGEPTCIKVTVHRHSGFYLGRLAPYFERPCDDRNAASIESYRALCDSEHPASPSHDHHESIPRCVPVGCGPHRRCTKKLRNRWSSEHGILYAVLSSASLGSWCIQRVHTPRRWGQACNAGTSLFATLRLRGLRTSWLIVAIQKLRNT